VRVAADRLSHSRHWRCSIDLAVQQLEQGVKKLGLRGAAIGGNVAGEKFADAKFHPVWAKAQELGVLLFIHPQGRAGAQ
jgi:aminocarboxymuconate-semialdehyde decarboxylase